MINPNVTISNDFLELPVESKLLYYRLIENADDEGFVDTGTLVLKIDGANRENLDDLIRIGYIREFESRVLVIRHWWVHNRHDMRDMKKTVHTEEKSCVEEDKETRIYKDVPSESHRNPIANQNNQDNQHNQQTNPVRLVGLSDDSIYYSLSDKDRNSLEAECRKHKVRVQELIKAIDISVKSRKEQTDIKTPYRYIIQIAEAKNWNIDEINKSYHPVNNSPESPLKHYRDIEGSLWGNLDEKQRASMKAQYEGDDLTRLIKDIDTLVKENPGGTYRGTDVSLFKRLADKILAEGR